VNGVNVMTEPVLTTPPPGFAAAPLEAPLPAPPPGTIIGEQYWQPLFAPLVTFCCINYAEGSFAIGQDISFDQADDPDAAKLRAFNKAKEQTPTPALPTPVIPVNP